MYSYRSTYSKHYSPSLLRKLSQTSNGSHGSSKSGGSSGSLSRNVGDGAGTLTTRFDRSHEYGRTRRRSSMSEYSRGSSQRLLSQWSSSGSEAESVRSARSDRMSLDSDREAPRRYSNYSSHSRTSRYSRTSSYQDELESKCESNDSDSESLTTRRFSRSCRVSEDPVPRKGSSSSYSTSRRSVKKKSETCDKCDGKDHETDDCPYYKKDREDHPDAQLGKPKSLSSSGGNLVIWNATVVSMPGDGDCLFHSLAHGLGNTNARRLRSDIAAFIGSHPNLEIAESPLKDWVSWDSKSTVREYARRMSVRGWGGGIEMAAFARLKRRDVHVFERQRSGRGGYKRISCFDVPATEAKRGPTINVIYCGNCHYNYLDVHRNSSVRSSRRSRSYRT